MKRCGEKTIYKEAIVYNCLRFYNTICVLNDESIGGAFTAVKSVIKENLKIMNDQNLSPKISQKLLTKKDSK